MPTRELTDIELALELVGEAYSFEDLGEFRTGVIEVLNRVVPSDRIAYNEIAPNEALAVMIPDHDYGLMPRFAALSHENPLIARFSERATDARIASRMWSTGRRFTRRRSTRSSTVR